MSEPDPSPSRRGALLALVAILCLLVGGLWLERRMHDTGKLEDCLMAGRKNCAPIQP